MSAQKQITGVPLLDLNAQFDSIHEEVREAIDRVLESQYFIMGPEVSSFEYCGSQHAIGCASGSDALLLSLMALDIGPEDAVITTTYTFFATGGAIARLGATPVFLDIDPISYNLDPNHVSAFLKDQHPLNEKLGIKGNEVKAIIPVHLYGQMAEMDSFMDLKKQYDVAIIEDAAQAIGSEYKGQRAGSIGDFGCFSFFPSKNLGGYGDGGMVTTNNDKLAEMLSVLRLHGAKPKYHHSMVGINSRLDAIQAAVLKVKLKYLDDWSDARREKAIIYNKLFLEASLSADYGILESSGEGTPPLADAKILEKYAEKIFLPQEKCGAPENNGRHIYHQYVIRTGEREQVMDTLAKNKIGYSVYYPVSLHEQECFRYLGYKESDCPVSSCASNTTLALPIYPELKFEQQEYIVRTIKKALNLS